MKSLRFVLIASCFLFHTALPAMAQTEPTGYREAVDLAVTELAAGNFAEARAQFNRAHSLSPNARTLRGIGMAEYELRNYGACIEALEQALASEVKPLDAALRTETEALLTKARNYVARVNLELQPGAATVIVDGVPVTLGAGNTLILRVGDHQLEFHADGRVPERRTLRVNGGEQSTMRVVLTEAPVADPGSPATDTSGSQEASAPATGSSPTAPTASASEGPGVMPWVIVGVSSALAITGTVLMFSAQSDIDKVEGASVGTRWSDIDDAHSAAPIKSGIGIALIGVGVAGIATGLVLAFSGGGEESNATQVAVGLGNVSVFGSF